MRLLSFLLLFALGVVSAAARANYVAWELLREDNWQALRTVDLNGDGAADLVFSHHEPGLGRELHVHYQQADGSFAATPQRIEIKTEIIAVGFADLRPQPGAELVLLAGAGVFSLSAAIEGYAGNLQQLFAWELIATTPDPERVLFFDGIEDIDQDGFIDLLLPGSDRYGFFRGGDDGEFALAAVLSTLDEEPEAQSGSEAELDVRLEINADEGVVVELNAERSTPFSGFIESRQAAGEFRESLLRTERWMPAAWLARINDDHLKDVVYLNRGSDGQGRFNVHLQRPEGGFAQLPDWSAPFDGRGQLRVVDLNGDGLADLSRVRGDGDEWDAHFFLNQGGRLDFSAPGQVMRFSGYGARLEPVRLEADSPPVLAVSYYTVPVVDAIRNASLNRVLLVYGSDQPAPGQIFNRRPHSRLEESFPASRVRALAGGLSLRYDVDGDGRNDALYVTDDGALAAKQIGPDLRIGAEPFWEYVAPRPVFDFEVMPLNDDDHPDLLLRHATTTTLLVAAP